MGRSKDDGDDFQLLLSCKLAICIRKKGLLDDNFHKSNKSKGQVPDENKVFYHFLGLTYGFYTVYLT